MAAVKVRLTWPARVLLAVFGLIVVAMLMRLPDGSDTAPQLPKPKPAPSELCYLQAPINGPVSQWCEHWSQSRGEWESD